VKDGKQRTEDRGQKTEDRRGNEQKLGSREAGRLGSFKTGKLENTCT
jgi:hypothetical protein